MVGNLEAGLRKQVLLNWMLSEIKHCWVHEADDVSEEGICMVRYAWGISANPISLKKDISERTADNLQAHVPDAIVSQVAERRSGCFLEI